MVNTPFTQDLDYIEDIVAGESVLLQSYSSGDTSESGTVVIFALDALGGTKKDIKIEFYLAQDDVAVFTPEWYVTRPNDLITFTAREEPDLGTITTSGAAKEFFFEFGDLAEGLQVEFRLAHTGGSNRAYDASLTYVGGI